jgi:hypothetical protein
MTSYEIAGTTVTMPVQVRDASAGTAIFEVDAAAASALLPSRELEVVETTPGRAQLAIALVDYRDNDLGSYLEVGLMLFVRPAAGGDDGTFIVHLPVDQPFTCEAGRRIWGFPKTLERIHVTNDESRSTWTLEMDGELVLRVSVPRGGDDEMPPLPMTAYTLHDGTLHATRFSQGGTGAQVVVGGEGVALELGSHRVSKELASLGLPAPAVLSTWTERMRATFEEPRPV